jgi:Zn finger protein HypA/HybF involved in hydrogenase expression
LECYYGYTRKPRLWRGGGDQTTLRLIALSNVTKMFLAKVIREAKNETFSNEIFLWELDKEVSECRDCRRPFSVTVRRHHCRNCGGIYCDECTLTGVEVGGTKVDRGCKGCVRGETPGENVRIAIEKGLSIFDTRANRKVTAHHIPLTYGSPFEEGSASSSPRTVSPRKDGSSPPRSELSSKFSVTSQDAPNSGYFEFANKMGLFCCVKVVCGGDGGDVSTLWEVSRPSYTAVPPNAVINGRFDPELPFFDLIVLMGNPFTPEGEAVYDTTESAGKISKCAAVANFRRYMIFRVECTGKNAMLKYKGESLLEPRLGNSVGRIGIFGKLGMKNEDKETLNFDTNIAPSAIRLYCASK